MSWASLVEQHLGPCQVFLCPDAAAGRKKAARRCALDALQHAFSIATRDGWPRNTNHAIHRPAAHRRPRALQVDERKSPRFRAASQSDEDG